MYLGPDAMASYERRLKERFVQLIAEADPDTICDRIDQRLEAGASPWACLTRRRPRNWQPPLNSSRRWFRRSESILWRPRCSAPISMSRPQCVRLSRSCVRNR